MWNGSDRLYVDSSSKKKYDNRSMVFHCFAIFFNDFSCDFLIVLRVQNNLLAAGISRVAFVSGLIKCNAL